MRASCTSRVRFDVITTTGGTSARNVPSSGIVMAYSESTSSRNASNSSSARSTSSMSSTGGTPVGDGVRARSSARRTRKRLGVELALERLGAAVGGRAAGLGGAEVQQLAGVVPLVHGLVGVEALVALEPDQLAAGPARRSPWRPRSCRRRRRPRAAAAAAAAARGRSTWPAPRRRGSARRRGAACTESTDSTSTRAEATGGSAAQPFSGDLSRAGREGSPRTAGRCHAARCARRWRLTVMISSATLAGRRRCVRV